MVQDTPFRENMVTLSEYKKLQDEKNNEIGKLKNEIASNKQKISDLEQKIFNLKKSDAVEIAKDVIFWTIVVAVVVFVFSKGFKYCHRKDPSGETGIINAERSLRRHMVNSGNQITALSCAVTKRNYYCDDRTCEVSYRDRNNQIQTSVYCCDNAYPEYTYGCVEPHRIQDAGTN